MTSALTLLHLDDHLAVIDKPAGLLVHRTAIDAHEEDAALQRLERYHRSVYDVNLARVREISPGFKGGLFLHLEGGGDAVAVSRRRAQPLRSAFGL